MLYFLLSPFGLLAQNDGLVFQASVTNDKGKPVKQFEVVIAYASGDTTQSNIKDSKGMFHLTIPYDREAELLVHCENMAPVRWFINTKNVPGQQRAWGYEVGGFVIILNRQ